MKKISVSLFFMIFILTMVLGTCAFAESAPIEISFGEASGITGEIVEIPLSIKASEPVKLIGVGNISYGEASHRVIGFSFDESLKSHINPELSNFDAETSSVVVFFNEETKFEGVIGTLQIRIRGIASIGNKEVTAQCSAKSTALDSLEVAVKPGKIEVTGKGENVVDDDLATIAMTSKQRAEDSIILKVDTSLSCVFGKMLPIDSDNAKVVPYIYNERTLVPLRFVSESLGAEVLWEEGWNYCLINKEGKQIKITFNSAEIEVNGEIITYDAPVQVVEGRTMVPIRFISEELGYHIHWNAPNKMVVITPADNPWVAEREAENTLIREVVVTLFLKGSF